MQFSKLLGNFVALHIYKQTNQFDFNIGEFNVIQIPPIGVKVLENIWFHISIEFNSSCLKPACL